MEDSEVDMLIMVMEKWLYAKAAGKDLHRIVPRMRF